ncbi:MAG: TraR/DksA C4-type zinc finger protein [Acidobacteriota bacterium]
MSTKRKPEQVKVNASKFWDEAAKRLRDEEDDLNATLAAAEAFSSEKIIDDWQERSSLNYEEALRHRLAQIREALIRLSRHTYGRCVECGAKIDEKRLATDPAISRCLACQTALESKSPSKSL